MTVVVQDLLTLPSPGTVALTCHTYKGGVTQAKLIALKVGAAHQQ
jgi:hypothetical protein